MRTCELFRDLVEQGSSKWSDARQLFSSARKLGKRLSQADKMNFTVANVVKRIYHIIREECASLKIPFKDHQAIKGGNLLLENLTLLVPKDMIRLNSLKQIT